MKINLDLTGKQFTVAEVKIMAVSQKAEKKELQFSGEDKELFQFFTTLKIAKNFKANKNEITSFTGPSSETILVVGLGEKKQANSETIRRAMAHAYKAIASEKYESVAIDATSFNIVHDINLALALMTEAITLTSYKFDKYKKTKSKLGFSTITLFSTDKKASKISANAIKASSNVAESINFARDLINEVPNVLHSVEYAKQIDKDVKTALKGKNVKVKILTKAEIKKEGMGMFLAVNAGSAHEARLVHLTYTPKKTTKNTKHYAFVGKGLTFDTGGYSLKPGASMMGMKFDMGGSATVYAAFRAAVLNQCEHKLSCILGMTDNAVSSLAVMPDSIVTARNGLTVEILNTDAEGRLVLGDCLDYACDLKPDYIVDAATLTGACLVALGSQVCAVLGNNDKFVHEVLKAAKEQDEYMWQLPIIDEWRDDMKSKIADLKNIGTAGKAGTATAAAFLEAFVKNDIAWAHLDIAGVCDSASHLPYCPPNGASGLMVRSLYQLLMRK